MARPRLQLIVSSPDRRKTIIEKLPAREQVAAVCYRIREGEIEFLLVRTRKGRWTFPKGGTKAGLTRAESAAMEAWEEGGVHGRIEEASFVRYATGKLREQGAEIRAYLCEVTRLGEAQEFGREPTWCAHEKARQRLCEGRCARDGAEFIRVLRVASLRIRRSRNAANMMSDPLQRVQFESAAINSQRNGAQRGLNESMSRKRAVVRFALKAAQTKVLQLEPARPNV